MRPYRYINEFHPPPKFLQSEATARPRGKLRLLNNDVRTDKLTERREMENDSNHTAGHSSESCPLIRESIEASLAILITHGHHVTLTVVLRRP